MHAANAKSKSVGIPCCLLPFADMLKVRRDRNVELYRVFESKCPLSVYQGHQPSYVVDKVSE